MKTIAQTLRELKTVDLSESMLKDIELIEELNLRSAYYEIPFAKSFEEWQLAEFNK